MIEKQLQKYIMPNICAMIGISLYVLADTFFISISEGANGITALNLVLPIYGVIYAIGAMIGIGSATRYSIEKAMGEKCDDYFSNAIIYTVLISLPFIVTGIFAPDIVLKFMGADATILRTGLLYTQIMLLSSPFFMINYIFTSFVRNDGAPNVAMAATLISGAFNIVFDYICMFPLKMGMPGAALATGLSPVVSMIVCLKHYCSKNNTIKFIKIVPSFKKLVSSCKLGVVAFIGEMSSGITTMVFNFVLLALGGNVAVAAYGVIANVSLIGIALFNGISQGLQPLASEVHGKGQTDLKERIYKHSLKIGMLISVIVIALSWIFSDWVIGIFNSEQSTQLFEYARTGIRLYTLGFLFATINIIKSGYYSAIDRAKASWIISILRGVVAIVFFTLVLSKMFGIMGVWLSFLVSELFTFVVTINVKKDA